MLKILVNAYAVSPNWGSEPGMGWNWIINLAKHCELYVITEGQWRKEIEQALSDALTNGIDRSGHLSKEQAERIHFYYNPLSDKVRSICWNQGDWRFYYYYNKWQKSTFEIACKIISENPIDIIHHLNMIGFREPGYLWKITSIPYVWGPFGGLGHIKNSFLYNIPLKTKIICKLKNTISNWQKKYMPRMRKIMKRADGLCCATSDGHRFITQYYRPDARLLNETGCYLKAHRDIDIVHQNSDIKRNFDMMWVGRFIFTKELPLALRVMSLLKDYPDIHLHIYGDGDEKIMTSYKSMCSDLRLKNIHWHGKIPNNEIQKQMQVSDILLFTSILEGTPHVVMEALGNNLPVVCFDTCGQGDCIDDSCGIKIPLSNPQQSVYDFVSAIEFLYKNPAKLHELKFQCNARQVQLSWDNKVSTMLSIYQEAILHFKKTNAK